MTRQEIDNRACELLAGGFNCAESLLISSLEHFGAPLPHKGPRIATCFGGGVGKTKEEMCGALSGGLMALGCLQGRDEPGMNWDAASDAAAEFRERFAQTFGSSICKNILATFGEQENFEKCRRLCGETAVLIHDLMDQAEQECLRECACAGKR